MNDMYWRKFFEIKNKHSQINSWIKVLKWNTLYREGLRKLCTLTFIEYIQPLNQHCKLEFLKDPPHSLTLSISLISFNYKIAISVKTGTTAIYSSDIYGMASSVQNNQR